MQRLRDLLDSDDPAVAEAARLLRAVDDLHPPRGAQDRVRAAIAARGRTAQPETAPAAAPSRVEPAADAMMIGPYRVTGVVGRGGMATVYAAKHALLGRPAIIKVLSPVLSQQRDTVQRFFHEARAAAAIHHAGIVELYDVGWTAEGAPFIVMEQLDGETLARRLTRGRLAWRAALAVTRQIAGVLSAAHARGIVHRDLKPENVFLTRDPEVPGGERIKLLDFGIAKLAGDLSSTVHAAKTGAVIATPTYLAPERWRGAAVDHRADLYALGCVAFELITGRPPALGEAAGQDLAARVHTPVRALATLDAELPHAVEHLVEQLLVQSPEHRVQTADQLIRAIDAITGRAPAAAPRWSAEPAAVSPLITTLSGAARALRRPAALAARRPYRSVAVVAAAAAIVIAVAIHRRGGDAPAEDPDPQASNPAVAASQESPAQQPPPAQPPPPGSEDATRDAPVAPQIPPPPARPTPPARPAPPARIEVTIDSVPPGAQIMLADRALGKTPFHRMLPRGNGELTLVVRLAGYRDRTMVVPADRVINQHITLVPAVLPDLRLPKSDRNHSVNPFDK